MSDWRPAILPALRSDREYRDGPPEHWTSQAMCAQTGPDDATWYPAKGGDNRVAKGLCAGCPVIAECLEWALEHEAWGIWGGTSERARREIRRQRRKQGDDAA